ncbi:MAG: magnesium transporter [Chloroflexia bacterium]|nr:magnesium transporter [Chloroflexia bacterium]
MTDTLTPPETAQSETARSLLEEIREAVGAGDVERAQACAHRMLEVDALALLEDLAPAELSRLFAILGDETLAVLLSRLDDRDAARILTRMSAAQAADILEEIDPDDATDIFAEVEQANPTAAGTILVEMEPDEAAEIRDLMAYEGDTAGGIMTPAFVAVFPDLRADETVRALRQVAEEAETINYVYVVDRDERLIGVLSLHNLVLSRPDRPVADLMTTDIVSVPVDADQEFAARLLTERNLLALPVVDADGRLIGIITQDDVADILEEEATEDIERLGGSQPLDTPYRTASVALLVRRRLGWLMFLFVAGFLTASVLEAFPPSAVLIPFIPLIIGTGGNVGSQTVTTLVRAMAVGEVQLRDVGWVLLKELSVGLAMGLAMAVVAFFRAGIPEGREIGLVVAATIVCVTLWSATVAAVLPLLLRRLNIDPAVVSAPLITTLVDATGLLIYLSIAGAILTEV